MHSGIQVLSTEPFSSFDEDEKQALLALLTHSHLILRCSLVKNCSASLDLLSLTNWSNRIGVDVRCAIAVHADSLRQKSNLHECKNTWGSHFKCIVQRLKVLFRSEKKKCCPVIRWAESSLRLEQCQSSKNFESCIGRFETSKRNFKLATSKLNCFLWKF